MFLYKKPSRFACFASFKNVICGTPVITSTFILSLYFSFTSFPFLIPLELFFVHISVRIRSGLYLSHRFSMSLASSLVATTSNVFSSVFLSMSFSINWSSIIMIFLFCI